MCSGHQQAEFCVKIQKLQLKEAVDYNRKMRIYNRKCHVYFVGANEFIQRFNYRFMDISC